MTLVDPRARVAPIFPAGVDRARRLLPLYHSAVWNPDPRVGADKRRDISRDPLLFALLYLTPYLRNETTGAISFSTMHLDIYDRLARWLGGGPDYSAWASHRTAGKTVSWFLVAPPYGAVHCGRDYCLMLSNTGDQAKEHLATLKSVLEDPDSLLVHDFPALRPGRPWTQTDARTVGGYRFRAAGMDKNILGARDRERRLKLVVADDPEEGPEDWTPASKAKTLGRFVNNVIPGVAENAAIVVVGTPVAPGSMLHDVVRATRGQPGVGEDQGEWVRAKGFDPHHYPAITAAGESAWPTRWPLATLLADQKADRRTFAIQYMCDVDDPAATQWWTDDPRTTVFRYDPEFPAVWHILSIDGAVTRDEKRSDESALVVLAVGPGVGADRDVCVEQAISGHWSFPEIREYAWDLTRQYRRTLRTWLVDATGSGDHWKGSLGVPPPAVSVEAFTTNADSKAHRIASLFDDYAHGKIWHGGRLKKLEAQMCAWKPGRSGPGVDDLIDAVRAAKDYALYGDASRAPAPSRWARHGLVDPNLTRRTR